MSHEQPLTVTARSGCNFRIAQGGTREDNMHQRRAPYQLSVFGASGLVNTPLPRNFLVIASEAIETDINPASGDHEYATHEADEERHLKNMRHEDNDFICHKTRGGIIATERLLEELPNLTYLLAFTVPI
jgi:hypothetical protein